MIVLTGLILSCTTHEGIPVSGYQPEGSAVVNISLTPYTQTKLTSTTLPFDTDLNIKCADVFTFEGTPLDNGSRLLSHYKFSPATEGDNLDLSVPLSFETTRGSRFFFVVANDKRSFDDLSVSTFGDILGLVYDIRLPEAQYMWTPGGKAEESRDAGLLMTGLREYYVTSSNTTIPITLRRRCFRINILSITNNLPSHYGDLTVKYVYLSNCPARQALGGTAYTPKDVYLNQFGYRTVAEDDIEGVINGTDNTSVNGLTALHGDVQIAHGATSSFFDGGGLYGFPNHNQDITTWFFDRSTWPDGSVATDFAGMDWPTRIIVVATLEDFPGMYFYYTMQPSRPLAANSTYDVSIVINNVGTIIPEQPLALGEAELSVTVSDWAVTDTTFDQ